MHTPTDPALLQHMMTDLIPLVYVQDGIQYVVFIVPANLCPCLSLFQQQPTHLILPPLTHRSSCRVRGQCELFSAPACWVPCTHRSTNCLTLLCACRVIRESTLAGALSEFIAALQLIMKQRVEDCAPDSRYIQFVIQNRHEMHEGMHTCLVSGVVEGVAIKDDTTLRKDVALKMCVWREGGEGKWMVVLDPSPPPPNLFCG